MSLDRVLIFGVGQTGRMVASILCERGDVDIVGFVDDDVTTHGGEFEGYPVLGGRDVIERADFDSVAVALGRVGPRRAVGEALRSADVPVHSAIHPSALIPERTRIGPGAIVGAGVVLYVNPQIGRGVFIGPSVTVSHDTVVGDYALLSVGATIGARVDIEEGAFIGASSSVMPPAWGVDARLRVGAESTVGVGAVVIRDVEAGATVVGIPAKPIQR